jgi:hypothetical protein
VSETYINVNEFDGTTHRLVYPVELSVLASAARTADQTQADQTNQGARGILVFLDVTDNASSGSITLEIDGKDPASGKYYALLTGTAVTSTGTVVYRVFPGAAVSANASANDALPRTWRVKVTTNNANAITYSVGAVLLP